MDTIRIGVLVIGGGPGGYVTAIRAGQLGLKTVLVEQRAVGGTCLNVGCIPSKALIHIADAFHVARVQQQSSAFGVRVSAATIDFRTAMGWKNGIVKRLTGGVAGLLKKQQVTTITGTAEIVDGKTCIVSTEHRQVRVTAEHLVLASGSLPVEMKGLPFGGRVISSTEALSLDEIPQRLVIVGAGYIGLELGIAFAKLGSEITIVEAADRILPAWDADLTHPVAKRIEQLGIRTLTQTFARGLSEDGTQLLLERGPGKEAFAVPADKILAAVGRRPRTEGFGLERLDLDMNGAFVRIDNRCATSMRNVWAIGDLTGEPMLAHRAMAQGEMVAELMAGRQRVFDKMAVPSVCFTDPEIVSVGLLPREAEAAGHKIVVGTFPFLANGRALSQHDEAGFIRIVACADDHRVLGLQAVGHDVAELSSTFGLALEMGALLEDIAATIHAHPTRGEAIQEAALGGLGHMLHL
jgi:dihydrolipoamide dehydrogenase